MNAKQRQDKIMQIVEEQGYVTVKQLCEALFYSSATINRDLNELQRKGLIDRTYGGAEAVRSVYVPIPFRSNKMRSEKRHIGRVAADFVKDGDTIFIDGSTTAQCMEQYLVSKKNLTVITNNMLLGVNLSQSGIEVICLGGKVVEKPSALCGNETVENASRYRVDKMFFSTGAATSDGLIATSVLYDLVFKEISKNANQIFYLVDSNKIDKDFKVAYGDFSKVDVVISDYVFPEATGKKYPKTELVVVGKSEEN